MSRGGIIFMSILVVIPAFVVLIGLGSWQVQRLNWKNEVIDGRQAALEVDPIPIPSRDDVVERMSFRWVEVTGTFIHDQEFYFYAPKSGKAGYRVVTPVLQRIGLTLLVDRGWVPADRRDPATRLEGQIEGEVTIVGIVRTDIVGIQGPLPDNDVENNEWFWVDPTAMSAVHGAYYRPALVVADDTANPGGWPQGDASVLGVRNSHLGYAITWFSLAFALVVIWILALRRRLSGVDSGPVKDWGED
jgi:surfeit locus 1 family protein